MQCFVRFSFLISLFCPTLQSSQILIFILNTIHPMSNTRLRHFSRSDVLFKVRRFWPLRAFRFGYILFGMMGDKGRVGTGSEVTAARATWCPILLVSDILAPAASPLGRDYFLLKHVSSGSR